MTGKANHNERALVERAKRDPKAFSDLYHLYFTRIFSYVSWRVGGRQDTEDLVSDIFLKVLGNLDAFVWKKNASFSSWVFRIAHNTVIDYYRSATKRDFDNVDDLPVISADPLLPDVLLERRQLFEAIFEEVQKLPKSQAEIITMRLFGELRNKEISEVLGIEERSVSSSLFRGIEKLRKALNESIGD